MKKILPLVVLTLSVSFSVDAQKLAASEVPAAAKTAFEKQYPSTPVKWEKEDGKFEAGFIFKKHSMSVLYSADGTITETEIDIDIEAAEIPGEMLKYLKNNYAGMQINETARITKADGSINYEAEVDGKDLIFDVRGKFIKSLKN